jgi:hypothetical protein
MRLRVAIVAAMALSDCLDPTEIIVVISTDVPCSQVTSTAIAVGKPGDDKNFTSAKTTACADDGGIGTIVVLPSHGIDDAVGIRVTLATLGAQADTCISPTFDGCIVARRSLSYYPHHPLTLPIAMQQICESQKCDPFSTCVNGSCIDAGPSCDQMGNCTIDAGPPIDAGSCVDIPPTQATPLNAQVTPHLVKTTNGYAISFETTTINDPTRAYQVVELDANGSPNKIVPIVTTLAAGTAVGPLGTDGKNFAATFVPAPAAYGYREIDPDGGSLHEGATPDDVQLARAGMPYDPTGPAFVFFFITSTGFPTFGYWPLTGPPPSTGISEPGATDPALAVLGGAYYGSYQAAGSCGLLLGTVGSSYSAAPVASFPLCTTLRVAENGKGVDLSATRETDNPNNPAYTLRARGSLTAASPSTIIDAVDDQAIVALAGTTTRFHIVYGVSQSVRDTIFDTATHAYTPPVTIASSTGFTMPAQGIGFDAIDEPGTMIHDVAFWASSPTPGIYFTRICN